VERRTGERFIPFLKFINEFMHFENSVLVGRVKREITDGKGREGYLSPMDRSLRIVLSPLRVIRGSSQVLLLIICRKRGRFVAPSVWEASFTTETAAQTRLIYGQSSIKWTVKKPGWPTMLSISMVFPLPMGPTNTISASPHWVLRL